MNMESIPSEPENYYNECCRVCLKMKPHMKSLLESSDAVVKLKEMFISLTNIQLELDFRSPSGLCKRCEERLTLSYTFQQNCKKSDALIKSYKHQFKIEKDPSSTGCAQTVDLLHNKNESCTNLCKDEKNIDKADESQAKQDVSDCNVSEVFEDSLYKHENNKNDKEIRRRALTRWLVNKGNDDKGMKRFRGKLKRFPIEEVKKAIEDFRKKMVISTECPLCQFKGARLQNVAMHMAHIHREMKGRWCSKCNRLVENLKEHKQIHTRRRLSSCSLCGKSVNKAYMIDHLTFHRDDSEEKGLSVGKQIQARKDCSEDITESDEQSGKNDKRGLENFCKKCNKKVKKMLTVHDLKFHKEDDMNGASENMRTDLTCETCGKHFKKLEKLKIHSRIHFNNAPFRCSVCGRTASTRSSLIEHQRVHTGEKPFICYVCGKNFTQASSLRTHMRQHTGRPEVCKLCSKSFCRTSELRLHMQKHAGEKSFLCTDCGKAFSQKSHLTEHCKTHSNDRPYKCNVCEKAFKQNSSLKYHMNVHTGYKPLKCDHCSYSCLKPFRLKQHMKQHVSNSTSGTPHVCQICNKPVSTTTLLNSHMVSVHNAVL